MPLLIAEGEPHLASSEAQEVTEQGSSAHTEAHATNTSGVDDTPRTVKSSNTPNMGLQSPDNHGTDSRSRIQRLLIQHGARRTWRKDPELGQMTLDKQHPSCFQDESRRHLRTFSG